MVWKEVLPRNHQVNYRRMVVLKFGMILSQKVGGENLQLMLPIVNIQKARKMVRCRC